MIQMFAPLQRYFDFKGRSRRAEYWQWTLMCLAVGVILAAVPYQAMVVFQLGWIIGTLIPSIAVTVRRFHDINRTGWWALYAYFVPPIVGQLGLTYYFLSVRFAPEAASPPVSPYIGIVLTLGLMLLLALPILIFLLRDGTPRANRFGPDPKGREPARVF